MSEFSHPRFETAEERLEAYGQLKKCVKRLWFRSLSAEQISERVAHAVFKSESGEQLGITGELQNGTFRFMLTLHRSEEILGPMIQYNISEDGMVTRADLDLGAVGAPASSEFWAQSQDERAHTLVWAAFKSNVSVAEERVIGLNDQPITAAEAISVKEFFLAATPIAL